MLDFKNFQIEELMDDNTAVIDKISSKDIAVIGISARLPMSDSIDEYWENLKLGVDCIANLPEARKEDMNRYLNFIGMGEDNNYSLGGYLKEIDSFDYRYFKISPKEASLIDPNQRLFLETALSAIEDAGYGGNSIKGTRTGIYLGYNSDTIFDYKRMIYELEPEAGPMAVPGNLTSVIAGRVAYMLDLRGPSMTVDTACSSSLVAIHLACQGLRNGDCEMALAGSVKLNLLPVERAQKLGIEASDYRARTFDDSSDGTGMGEGVASVLLKPLSRAIEDKDNIYAVIKGSAINQDGSSIGLTAPNAVAQEDVIIRAWEDAGVDPETISYIEAHGTGTVLGDPIEIDGIQKAFSRYTQKKQFCAIGSVKPNIGHLDNAAGIAGAIKVILALKNKLIPPSINFNKPNTKINFMDSPVYVVTKPTEWAAKEYARRAGISAFGLSGTNCHMIFEEYLEATSNEDTSNCFITSSRPELFTLSAKNKASLLKLIDSYKMFLENNPQINLKDLCYTSNIGRGHYQYRLAIIAESIKALREKLTGLNSLDIENYEFNGVYCGNTEASESKAAFRSDANVDLTQLAHSYINGEEIDWTSLYKGEKQKKVSLPTYSFEHNRCWIEVSENSNYFIRQVAATAGEGMSNPKSQIVLKGKADEEFSETEKAIARAWGEILGFKEISIADNFYELGGDSISAMKLVNLINKQMNIMIDIAEVLKYQTINEIAACIDKRYLHKTVDKKQAAIEQAGEKPYYQLSSAQKRIYILNEFEGIGTSYNISGVLEIDGVIDRNRLEEAFYKLIEKHETLRTSFEIVNGEPVQIVHNEASFGLQIIDGAEKEPNALVREFIKPYNLKNAPLFRAGLIELSKRKHLLVVDMHHIISDGASIAILIRELVGLYKHGALKLLRIHYKDFAEWQSGKAETDKIKGQEEYWIRKFSGEIPVLNLPLDNPRPSVQSFEGDCVNYLLDEVMARKLTMLARETGTTLYVMLLAVFNVLLSKYSGQEDIVVGSLISGRNNADLEDIIGMFVNTLPMRNYPSGSKSFKEFLSEVRNHAFQAYDNQDCQFESLIDKLDIPRDFSRNPLFDVLFVMQNIEIPQITLDGLNIKPFAYKDKTSRFDIALQAIEENNGIRFIFEFCTNLFNQKTIERLAKHFVNIINEITNDPDMLLKDIQLMDEREKEHILVDFNDSAAVYDRDKTIHQMFEEQADIYPENIAVVYQNSSLTYKELNEKSNQLASLLRAKGVMRDNVVAIVAERSIELITGILAILKAGGAYLPINPAYPAERIGYMLEDSCAKLVLTQAAFKGNIRTHIEIINLNDEELYNGDISSPKHINNAEGLAYVIYTSGSTGKPKGVMVEHRALNNFLSTICNRFNDRVDSSDRCLSLTNISFDVSVCEIFLPITRGAALVLFDNDVIPDIYKLADTIAKEKITFAYIPPTILKEVYSQLKAANEAVALNKLLVGVEPIKDYVLEDYRLLTPEMQVVNGYGPTEATICATMYRFEGKELQGKNVPIGKPLHNLQIYILDQYDNPTPVGVPGELCISGDGLARGYLGRPELTAEKFVVNPFDTESVIYRTGDLARWLPDGNIEFIGRVDNQVKIRGYRIELGEIESQLLKYEPVKEAAVLAREDEKAGKYLCAYYTSTREIAVGEIREYLAASLPEFMLPSYYIRLEKLPLTPNGKVDRSILPPPDLKDKPTKEYEAPRNDEERVLASIWENVLGMEKVGINDSFFELGGDSIKAIKVSSLLQQHGFKLDIKHLFKNSTIGELSRYVESSTLVADQSAVIGEARLTPIQTWFFEQSFTEAHHWNQAIMLHRREGFAEAELKKTMTALLEHHDALRSVFSIAEGEEAVQLFRDTEGTFFTLDIFDLTSEVNPKESIVQHSDILQAGMDLANGPLVKLGLFKTINGDHLLIAIHHLLIDGVSWRILLEDFVNAYNSIINNTEVVFPVKTHSYKLWSSKLWDYSTSKELLSEMEYWAKIENSPVDKIITHSYENGRVKDSETLEFSLTREATEKLLKHVSKAYNTDVNEILLTALGYAAKRQFNVEKLPIMLEGHGRIENFRDIDVSRTIGWFTSIFPIVLDMSYCDNLPKQIKHVKESLRSIPNKGVGYCILRHISPNELVNIDFSLKPEITFNYLGQFDSEVNNDTLGLSDISVGRKTSDNSERLSALDIYGIIAEGKLHIGINYSIDHFEASSIEALNCCFEECLQGIIEHCMGKEETELTPSDFSASSLDMDELDDLFDMLEN